MSHEYLHTINIIQNNLENQFIKPIYKSKQTLEKHIRNHNKNPNNITNSQFSFAPCYARRPLVSAARDPCSYILLTAHPNRPLALEGQMPRKWSYRKQRQGA
jgi:hypothetical protein